MLELTRGKNAAVDEARSLGDTEYLLRHGDGAFRSARFPWIEALYQGSAGPTALQNVC